MPTNRPTRHMLTTLILVCLIAAAPLFPITTTEAQTVEPTVIPLREGGPKSKKLVVKDAQGTVVDAPQFEDIPENEFVKFNKTDATFEPKKAVKKTTVELKFKVSGEAKSQKIDITVLPKITKFVVKHGKVTHDNPEQIIKISRGSKWNVELLALDAAGNKALDADNKEVNVVAAVASGENFLGVTTTSPPQLEAKKEGVAELTLTADNIKSPPFKFQVVPPIDLSNVSSATINEVRLTEGATKPLGPSIKDTKGQQVDIFDEAYGAHILPFTSEYVEVLDDSKGRATVLRGKTLPRDLPSGKYTARIEFPTLATSDAAPTVSQTQPFDITVVPKGANIYFEPPTQILFPGAMGRINAYFKNRRGINQDDEYRVTEWRIGGSESEKALYSKYVAIIPEGNSVTVIRLDPEEAVVPETGATTTSDQAGSGQPAASATGTGTNVTPQQPNKDARRNAVIRRTPRAIPIEADAEPIGGGDKLTGKAFVLLRDVTKFQPLSVKLNVMDDTTAKDLYGGVAASEYYVLMVRMFNDLRDDETKRYTGSSIIVYSGSIEVAVNLEKQYDKASKSAKRKPANPAPSPSPEKDTRPGTESYVADDRWYEVVPKTDIQVGITDENYSNKSPTEEDETKLPFGSDPVCNDTITYRPLMFEMVVNTADRREGRSTRSKIFDALELVGLGASFSSAIRFPRPGRDLPIVADRLSNLLVPGLEKFFPSLAEQHRQNIVSQVMKPLEEVPFGSDITRVLFIPKRPLRGMMPNHKVRISQVCPYYFKIRVAVVDKTGQTTVEQGVQRQ